MRTAFVRLIVPTAVLVLVAGCSAGGGQGTLSADLQKDLEASAADRPVLATTAAQPMRFVSEIEQVQTAEPVQRAQTPRRVAAQSANLQQNETRSPTPEPQHEIQVAQLPSETAQAPAPESDVPTTPSVAPRPSPMPVDVPSMEGNGRGGIGVGRDEGRGVGIGDIIGVVIRGGGVGPDHCPPRRRGRGRLPIPHILR
ncbi:MAG: hypothetical protein ABIZ91_13705 [Gemmatimonadaceae bacterium]